MTLRGEIAGLQITLPTSRVHGALQFLHVNENTPERVIEFVYAWNLRDVEEAISIAYDDQWFKGGLMGVSVYVLDVGGNLKGVLSGQQGYIEFGGFGFHPVVTNSLPALDALMTA